MTKWICCFLIGSLCFGIGCTESPANDDLTVDIVGTYMGTLTLNLGTDSLEDIPNQQLTVAKIDDETISIVATDYSDRSPMDSLVLEATLTRTPYFFIQSEGVMLSIPSVTIRDGQVVGVPFSVSGGGPISEDGKYDRELGELLFTIEVSQNGMAAYELFQGNKQ